MAGTYQTVGSVGQSQITPATRTVYNTTLIDTLFQWLGLRAFAVDGPNDIPQQGGQTMSWRQFGKLSAATTALTEGSPPNGSNLTVNEITATVGQYGDFVEFSDKILDTGPDPYAVKTLELQGHQAALTFDALIQAAVLAGTNVTYASTATARNQITSAMTFSTAKLDRVIRNLQSRHVPFVTSFISPSTGIATVTGLPAYIAFVTPQMWETMKSTSGVQKVDSYQSGNTIFPNEVGKYDSIRFIMSTTGYISTAMTGTITGATNATPIVITAAAHGLVDGDVVTISGVGGNTAANGTFYVDQLSASTFALYSNAALSTGVAGNGAYTSGGTFTTNQVQLMPVFGQRAFGVTKLKGKAITALVRNIDTPDSTDKLGQKGHIGWKAYFVAKILDQDQLERYEFYAA